MERKQQWNSPGLNIGRIMKRARFWKINNCLKLSWEADEDKQVLSFTFMLNDAFQQAVHLAPS